MSSSAHCVSWDEQGSLIQILRVGAGLSALVSERDVFHPVWNRRTELTLTLRLSFQEELEFWKGEQDTPFLNYKRNRISLASS